MSTPTPPPAWTPFPDTFAPDDRTLAEILDGGQAFRWRASRAADTPVRWTGTWADLVVEVERSADGRSFSSIGTVAARNAGAATQAYRFDDTRALSGWNYYRIKSVDNDGRIRYTSIVKVMLGKAASSITVNPNPVEGERMNLQLLNQPAGRYTLRLLTMDGRSVLTRTIEHAGGNATQQITLPRLMANGQYSLEVMGEGEAPATLIPLLIDNK